MGLLELQQGQKIKKMACWNSSKGKKSKKQGCWNSSKGKKSKRRAAGVPVSQKMRQTLARLPYDAIKQWCQRLRHHA